MLEPVIQQSGDLNRASVTFTDLVSSVRPSASIAQVLVSPVQLHASDPQAAATAPPAPLFATHHVPEDQVSTTKEAIRQAGLMMEQMRRCMMPAKLLMMPALLFKLMFR